MSLTGNFCTIGSDKMYPGVDLEVLKKVELGGGPLLLGSGEWIECLRPGPFCSVCPYLERKEAGFRFTKKIVLVED